jgi:hypothetical protein
MDAKVPGTSAPPPLEALNKLNDIKKIVSGK